MDNAETLAHLAAPYALLRERGALSCHEPSAGCAMMPESEIQALWNCGIKSALRLEDGRDLKVLQHGTWNHSEGPDFHDAVLSIDGLIVRGDVEIHVTPHDWDLHGHASNPDYNRVVLHVTWERGPAVQTLPPATACLVLKDQVTPEYSIESRSSYPCQNLVSAEQLPRLLESAGYYRIQLKTRHLTANMTSLPPQQVFYEELFGTLGYQKNVMPFRQLARDIPLSRILEFPSLQRYAVLAGVGGLLKNDERDLWELWLQTGIPPSIAQYAWDMRFLRPANTPRVRLAGAVGILNKLNSLLESPLARVAGELVEASQLLMEPLKLKISPIGRQRANAIVTNLIVPYRLATGALNPALIKILPGETISTPMQEVWRRLTGSTNHLPADALQQQGLLQIYTDYCHNIRMMCDSCPVCSFA